MERYSPEEIRQGIALVREAKKRNIVPGLPGYPWVVLGNNNEVLSYNKKRKQAESLVDIISKLSPQRKPYLLYLMDLAADPRAKDPANIQRIMGAYVVVDEGGKMVRRHLSEQVAREWIQDAHRKHPDKSYKLILDADGFDLVPVSREQLRRIREIHSPKSLEGGLMRMNPVEALAVINPKRGLGDRFVDIIDYVKENPLMLLIGGLGAALSAYLIYMLARMGPAMGALRWNNHEHRLTPEDRLWMGRMLIGEVGETGWEDGQKDEAAAAVLWSVATRHMSKRKFRESGSFTKTMRMFSQPINPIWSSASACSSDGKGCCNRGSVMCSPERIARRARIQGKSWNELPARTRKLVDLFSRGQLSNPIPGYNDFAGARHISQSAISSSRKPAITIGGNTFISRPSFEEGTLRVI